MAECEECVELAAKIEKLEDELMDANDRANSAERVSDSFDAIPRKLVHALRDGVVAFNKRIGG